MKEYTLTTRHGETTVQLSDEDAEAYGDAVTPVGSKSKRPTNKAATPTNKAATPTNKAATPENKAAAAGTSTPA